MQDEHSVIGKILAKYPEITQEEQQVLEEWKAKNGNNIKFDLIVNAETRVADLNRFLKWKEKKERSREKYHAAIANLNTEKKVVWWNKWQTYVAAASILMAVSLIGYKWFADKDKEFEKEIPVVVQNTDVAPGQYKAKLTLADGSIIVLDSFSNNTIVQQGRTNVFNKDGKLVYEQQGTETKILYNKLETTKGQTYATVLSDGTKVWLNAQSSIRYPVAFTGNIRQVEITGEAFFEVVKSSIILANGQKGKVPFIVNAPGLEVEVLGTHFNVNSYGDEDAVKTTLVEGKVKVRSKSGNAAIILQPGEQAALWQTRDDNKLELIKNVDVDVAVAWRYGNFQFNEDNLETVLRQIVRWYDVDIIYSSNIPKRSFWGKISRNNSLSQVLETLETNNVHFKIEGKKILVSP